MLDVCVWKEGVKVEERDGTRIRCNISDYNLTINYNDRNCKIGDLNIIVGNFQVTRCNGHV